MQRGSQTVNKAARLHLAKAKTSPQQTLGAAVKQLDEAGTGALVLCEEHDKFFGLLTDGDIRRAFLRGVAFDDPCMELATKNPFTTSPHQRPAEMLLLMNKLDINHLPLLDEAGRAIGLVLRQDLMVQNSDEMSAVIMAGGFGTRLMPLTTDTPKPMLPIGDRPLMEHTIERLRKSGIHRVNITTHHLSEKIKQHFGNGSNFGVELSYVTEEHPLGTAGGLGFIHRSQEPILVLNGDILTSVNFRDLLAFHRENRADVTVGVRPYHIEVPYGVLDCDGVQVKHVREKPKLQLLVNAGIYILEPFVSHFIPSGRRCDMTDLIKSLLEARRKVVGFPIMEYWLDIGQRTDYDRANEDVRMGRLT